MHASPKASSIEYFRTLGYHHECGVSLNHPHTLTVFGKFTNIPRNIFEYLNIRTFENV